MEIRRFGSGMPGYSFNSVGNNLLVLTRRNLPNWAALGIRLFLIGLLALRVKQHRDERGCGGAQGHEGWHQRDGDRTDGRHRVGRVARGPS